MTSRATPGQRHWLVRLLRSLPDGFERRFQRQQWPLLALIGAVILVSIPLIVTPLPFWPQFWIAVLLIGLGWFIVHLEGYQDSPRTSEYLHLFLVWLSIVTTLRYFYYRTFNTLNFDGAVNTFFSLLLYGAELYAVVTLILAYFQTVKLKHRTPIPLDTIPQAQWPNVDIYIPTYNEDVEIVRKTALAAMAVDYPSQRKRVYVLDDGRKFPDRRKLLQEMCDQVGCTMLVRDNNDHAKAGNINTAMRRTGGDLILILDCDHIPTRDILQNTVGFFQDPKVFMVQTPHWFFNPDPFERNLLTEGRVPVGNELFYKVLQKGNDFWNAAFFCGSAAVIRKAHLLKVGGIAVETVTEDCHTSLRLHSLGYKSVYYDKIMVAGLAPEKFSSYVGQQVRWARGMAQILRLENPMFNRKLKLSLPQRICYLSATTHFFFGFPRLMYAIAPVLFLLFGVNSIRGLGVVTLAYALPHILLAMNANYITYKTVRFSFWNEIFEYAMAFQDGIVTFMALINPKLGNFNVTDKGQVVAKRSFDWESAKPSVIVAILIGLSLMAVPFWLILRPQETQAAIINASWSVFNLLLLSAAILVALEQPQLRRSHRLDRKLEAVIYGNRQTWHGRTIDVSETGARIQLTTWPNLPDEVELELIGDYGARAFVNARVMRVTPQDEDHVVVSMDFVDLSQAQSDALVLVLYSDVKQWYSQYRQEIDRPFAALAFLASGLPRAFKDPKPAKNVEIRKQIRAAAQVYWEGHFYSAIATEINTRNLRLHLPSFPNIPPEQLQQVPVVGLLLSQYEDEPTPTRLLAEIKRVKPQPESDHTDGSSALLLDITFPKALDPKQGKRIRELINSLE
ncbi:MULTISPECIES: UDP-forming cellulose synthase catalytic subunit [unclassified Leptolyngbya]|uniref:UDP-forming cellulose synthase catalytic subunit n=1 Tax=unclassified Leptolyngbya TaxID=2650499 RepID=UPI00168295E0|nr:MULTISPECIES: UDP-forming cellulose synthase catalytic subunit [unclassified Leptolyngbya]MBD1909238.1 UDP-forming cellulose synthase catalytic subunit [Leptolyngbya sp. FACHB-8]MBD2156594.1 UDP-forming cellulose synthase catalytic subunit [Leptolyngbya sp. FACHB-16]